MISVCMATYNGERYIKEQLQSVLAQIGEDDEVVVSDDGSTDGTPDIISAFNDRRIKVAKGPRLHSPTRNFENALAMAKGDIIFLADQDDVWAEDKVRVCMEALTTADCVVSDAWVTDNRLNVTQPSLYAMMRISRSRLGSLLCRNGYTGCCMAFRRCVLNDALPFPKDIPMHDIWIGNVAAFFHTVKFIDDRLVMFRRHDNAASCNGRGSRFSAWQKAMFRWHVAKRIALLGLKKKEYSNGHLTQYHHTYI